MAEKLKDFPEIKEFLLEENYRSTQVILITGYASVSDAVEAVKQLRGEADPGRQVDGAGQAERRRGEPDVQVAVVRVEQGRITDRRAGRIPSEVGTRLVKKLRAITLPGVEVFVEPVKEYRFCLVLRGEGLADGLTETDPQKTGVPPLPVEALRPEAEYSAGLVNQWLAEARKLLADEHPANGCNLRGLAKDPGLPQMGDMYGWKAGAIATYPMYKGVAKLVGMDVLPVAGETLEDEVEVFTSPAFPGKELNIHDQRLLETRQCPPLDVSDSSAHRGVRQTEIGTVDLVIGAHVLRPGGIGMGAEGRERRVPGHSTVTDFARFRGWSTSVPLSTAT